MKKESIKIKNAWLEGNDFHIVNINGRHIIYKDIKIKNIESPKIPKSKGIAVHEILISMINSPTKYTLEIPNVKSTKELRKVLEQQ